MEKSRDCSLPDGLSDIGEYILRTQKDALSRQQQAKFILQDKAWKRTPELFKLLAQRIDHDLLFTEDFSLVAPKIHALIHDECERVIPTLPLYVTPEMKADISKYWSIELWREICRQRPHRLDK